MLTRRSLLQPLPAFLLTAMILCAAPATAQEAVPLKLVHSGAFLPPGTALVVLTDPVAEAPEAGLQPRFLPRDAYPLDATQVLRQDTLGAGGATRARYARTASAGVRYFVYARLPQGTVYWSYSAPRDSIKYDTVDRGVMAVAPVQDRAVADAIRQTFFADPILPNSSAAPSEAAPTAPPPDPPSTPPAAGSPADAPAGILLPAWLFFGLLGGILLLAAGILYLGRRARAASAASSSDPPPGGYGERQGRLAEVEGKHERLQETYNALLARHKTLVREVQRLRDEAAARAKTDP